MSNPCFFMRLLQRFMQVFFDLLYHPFAFTYDFVATVVSFGSWNDWVLGVLPFISGTHILELGHGPGHLQLALQHNSGLDSAAIDESAPMGRLAKRRLGHSQRLARAVAQRIPFSSETFDSVISTFPSEYIFDAQTLSEVHRVLRSGGRLIILPAALPKNPLSGWLFKVTGQNPPEAHASINSKIIETLSQANFSAEIHPVEVKSAKLLIVVAEKKEKHVFRN